MVCLVLLLLLPLTSCNHNCLEQSELVSVEDFRYKKVGYNTKNTFIVSRGGSCQFTFDQRANPKFFMVAQKYVDENEDQMGSQVRYDWELYQYYKGRCVWEKSSTDSLQGQMMDYQKMHSGQDGTFCRYILYFQAADCGECPDASRRVVYYSYIDRTTESDQNNAFWKTMYLWL